MKSVFCSGSMVLAILVSTSAPAAAAEDPLQAKVEAIRDRFVAEVRRCGLEPVAIPSVEILSAPGAISYSGKAHALRLGRWETLPPPYVTFFAAWAKVDFPGQPARTVWDSLFNDFLVGHELGHWIADETGRLATIDHQDAEIEANQIAIAFADHVKPGSAQKAVGKFSYLLSLPDPLPPGTDSRAFFNAHYDSLAFEDHLAYNWYQGRFMQEAWTRHEMDLCVLIARPPATGPGE